jgi:hypothetical protein
METDRPDMFILPALPCWTKFPVDPMLVETKLLCTDTGPEDFNVMFPEFPLKKLVVTSELLFAKDTDSSPRSNISPPPLIGEKLLVLI